MNDLPLTPQLQYILKGAQDLNKFLGRNKVDIDVFFIRLLVT